MSKMTESLTMALHRDVSQYGVVRRSRTSEGDTDKTWQPFACVWQCETRK